MANLNVGKKCILGACITAALGTVSAAEPVGVLSRLEGHGVVSQGAQYVKAREGMVLKDGNRVMLMEGGSAKISFNDGCEYKLADNELLTLGSTSTCAGSAVGSYKIDPYTGVSDGPAAFQQAAISPPQPPQIGEYGVAEEEDDNLLGLYVLGGLAAAGLIWAAVDDDDDDDVFVVRRAASP